MIVLIRKRNKIDIYRNMFIGKEKFSLLDR